MRGRGSNRFVEGNPLYVRVSGAQQIIRPVLDPAGYVGVGGAAVGWVVLEASILRRIVGWRDHDAIGEVFLASAVIDQNGA